jgi:short-subunit dehydrogenase
MVTGAASGMGDEWATCCAEHGFDLLIAAAQSAINDAAQDFRTLGVAGEAIEADLATLDGVDRLYAATTGRSVEARLANAGHGVGHGFLDQRFDAVRHVIATNLPGTLSLIQQGGGEMRARGQGRLLLTGSVAGFIPGTCQAGYNGTKAFLHAFSFTLRNARKDTGVTVTCLMPGATDPAFFARADRLDTTVGQAEKDDPAAVATTGFDARMQGAGDVVSGWKNRLQTAMANVTPAGIRAAQHCKKAAPGSDKP